MAYLNKGITSVQVNKKNKRCKTCIYSGNADGCVICNYILYERERRGCPGGDACTKYVKKTRARKVRPLEYV